MEEPKKEEVKEEADAVPPPSKEALAKINEQVRGRVFMALGLVISSGLVSSRLEEGGYLHYPDIYASLLSNFVDASLRPRTFNIDCFLSRTCVFSSQWYLLNNINMEYKSGARGDLLAAQVRARQGREVAVPGGGPRPERHGHVQEARSRQWKGPQEEYVRF